MRTTSADVIQRGAERARLRPWRGDATTAHLAAVPGSAPLSASFVEHCVARAAVAGYDRVVSGALSPGERTGYEHAGFVLMERLHLLAHGLDGLPAPAPLAAHLRRGNAEDRGAVLAVDGLAFPEFWQLDGAGIDEALAATPSARYRVAVVQHAVVGYAITGRAGRRGYLQRLGVAPEHQRGGIGSALVLDGLRWLRRWRAVRALVNTQHENAAAYDLYISLGFRREASGLVVLSREL